MKFRIEVISFLIILLIALVVIGIKSGLLAEGSSNLAEKGRGLFPEDEKKAIEACLDRNFKVSSISFANDGKDQDRETIIIIKNQYDTTQIKGFIFKFLTDGDELFAIEAIKGTEVEGEADKYVLKPGEKRHFYQFRWDQTDIMGMNRPFATTKNGRTYPEDPNYKIVKVEVIPVIDLMLDQMTEIHCHEIVKELDTEDFKYA